MRKKFIHDISSNTVQLLINQFCGLLIFYVLSVKLDNKSSFGEINWSLAVLLTSFSLLSFGIDQVAVKKTAAGNSPDSVLSVYAFHVFFTGVVFYSILLAAFFCFPAFFKQHQLLLLLGAGKLMIFFSTPFKQVANGLEQFRQLLLMSVCSNVIRSLALLILVLSGQLTIPHIVVVFIAGDLAELLLSFIISTAVLKIPFSISWNKEKYIALLKESLPVLGVVIFTSAMARFDWIFIGLMNNNQVLAEYSFAYKIFELASLPLLVIAPVLIPRFTKRFHPAGTSINDGSADLLVLLRIEMVIASLSALLLNLLWLPVINPLTNGNYGAVNVKTILILSACLPFLYFNNFLWTVNFAKGKLKMILYIIAGSFLVNITGDVLLIPSFKGEGAAAAFLVALIIQSILYFKFTIIRGFSNHWFSLLACPGAALAAGFLAKALSGNTWLVLTLSLLFFTGFIFLTGQLRAGDKNRIKEITGL
jgi:O-antigen/teichoic acid export membrane protein